MTRTGTARGSEELTCVFFFFLILIPRRPCRHPGAPIQAQRGDVQRRDQAGRAGRAAVRVPAPRHRDAAALRGRAGQPVAVRRRGEPGADDQAQRPHVAVHAGVQHRRQHQVLRVPGDRGAGGQQGDRSRGAAVRDAGPD